MGEAAKVYAEELQKLAYGHPLWWPEHTKGPGGRERQIEIGDVGYIDTDGAFHPLFNIAHEREHELNAGKTPPNFSPLIGNLDELIETKTCFLQPGPQSSSSIKRHQSWTEIAGHDLVSGGGVELSYRFECSKKQGAILMLWDDAAKTELQLQQTHLMKYMKAHHESWYRFAYETLGINCEREDIILVRGFIKTSCWTVAALAGESDHTREVMLNGQLGPLFNVGVGHASHRGQLSSIQQRSGPITRMGISESMARAHWQTLLGPTCKASQSCDALAPALDSSFRDQCVFLNYYKIKYNSRFLRKIVAAAGASDFADPDGSIDREVSGLLVEPSPSGDDVQLQTESSLAKPLTPLDIVLDYILECSDASIAIASYQDLEAFELEDHWSSSLAGVLRSLSPRVQVDVQNSIGTLSGLHTCSSPVLPLEITLLIIMNISNDISALKSCSLVCRSWLSLCQPYLFDTIKPLHGSMDSEQRLQDFHASINTSTNPPHFCNWVRTLRLIGTNDSSITISTGVLSSILAKLPMLRVLELEQVVITNHVPGVVEMDPPLGQTNLDVLSIHLVRLEDLSQNPLASILRLFLSIGMLCIRNLEIVDNISYPWESPLPLPGLCQVKGLIFETSPPAAKNDMVHTTVQLLDAMLEPISLCSLQSLETRCHTVDEVQAVGQLIRKAHGTLQDIGIDLSNIVGESYDCKDIADTLSLHVCKSLHRLCIKVFPDINQKNRSSHQWQRASELLMEVLSAASPSIQSMTIPLRSHNVDFEDHHMINWKALRLLKAGFENLSELIFVLTPECRCPQLCERYISSQLPELHSRGLLKFSNMKSFMLQPAQHLRSPCRIPTQGSLPSQSNGSHNVVRYAEETLISGMVVPQTYYVAPKPYKQLPSIKFMVGETLGIKLVDALNPGFTGLDFADFEPLLSEHAVKLQLRIEWPGYPPWSDTIHILDYAYHVSKPRTLKSVAQIVARKIQIFWNDVQSSWQRDDVFTGIDGWQVENFSFEKLVLLELNHVSKGCWQPVIASL